MPQVTPNSKEEQPPALLRHAEMRSIQEEIPDVVPKVMCLPRDPPSEVAPQMFTHPRYVLHHECQRPRFSDGGQEVLVEKISTWIGDTSLSDSGIFGQQACLFRPSDAGEPLTGWTADDHVRWIGKLVKELSNRELVHISLLRTPEDDRVFVLKDPMERVRSSLVGLDRTDAPCAGCPETEGHAASACEEVQHRIFHDCCFSGFWCIHVTKSVTLTAPRFQSIRKRKPMGERPEAFTDSVGESDGRPILAQGQGRIRPRARLLKTIGAELISSEVVAVIELVRNSYDADATRVDLIFKDPHDSDRGSLEIRDNGHGMTRSIVLGPWLEPATDHKRHLAGGETGGERSPSGRRRLGSKGVGRFAVQRLGDELKLRTRADGGPNEVIAWFDWDALQGGRYLDEVRIPWEERRAGRESLVGTSLIVTGLRDRWSTDRFDKLRLGLSRLISPSMEEDFNIFLEINGAVDEITSAVDPDSAMYQIKGIVEPGGHATISYQDINGDSEVWDRNVLWPEASEHKCGPLEFQISAWDLDSAPLKLFLKKTKSQMGLRDFRKTIREHSGISLYRDGFRILPYGEPDNDWLRLDRRRVNNPTMRLSNNQVLGNIHLSADGNPHLQDQTNREGLVANEAYTHLQAVVVELLGYLENRRFSARRAMDVDWQRRTSSLPSLENEGGDTAIQLIRSLSDANGNKAKDIERLEQEFKDIRRAAADSVRHYAGLASSGQMAGLVFRQLSHPLRQVESELDLVMHDLEGQPDPESIEDMQESVRAALQHLATMSKRMEKLDPLAIGGRGRRITELCLEEALREVAAAFKEDCDQAGVVLTFTGAPSVRVTTNREVVQHALAGLLDNAVYWAQKGDAATPMVTIQLSGQGFNVSDNGPGIPDRVGTTVFEPHFSMKEDAHGLGLTLVRDLLKTIGARIQLQDLQPATFTVRLGR